MIENSIGYLILLTYNNMSEIERITGGSSGLCTPTIDGLPAPCPHLWKDGE
jgi:hypothetical protein